MDILKIMQPYISPSYEQHSKTVVSRIRLNMYKTILNTIVGQNNIINESYITLTYEKETNIITISNPIKYIKDDMNSYSTIHEYKDKNTYIQLHSYEEILELLLLNENQKYLYIPIGMSSNAHSSGHMCLLIFNMELNIVLYFDPNGFTKYNNNTIINKIFDNYIVNLSELSHKKFTYIPQNEWMITSDFNLNAEYRVTNNDFNYIDSGHCVCITIIIAYLLTHCELDINTIIGKLGKLNEQTKIDTIMGFTDTMYSILHAESSDDVMELEKLIYQLKL